MKDFISKDRNLSYLQAKNADESIRKDRNTHPLQVFRLSGYSAIKLWLSVYPVIFAVSVLLLLHFLVPFLSENTFAIPALNIHTNILWYWIIVALFGVGLLICWVIQIWQIIQTTAVQIIVYENAISIQTGIMFHKYSSRRFTGVFDVCDYHKKLRSDPFDWRFYYGAWRHFLGWVFDFADVYMDCPGGEGERLVFKGVAYPEAFMSYFLDKRRVAEDDAVSVTFSR